MTTGPERTRGHRRSLLAVLVTLMTVVFPGAGETATCATSDLCGFYLVTLSGVDGTGTAFSLLATLEHGGGAAATSCADFQGTAVLNEKAAAPTRLPVSGRSDVASDCFVSFHLLFRPEGEVFVRHLRFIGYVHDAGQSMQFSSLFDSGLQAAGMARKLRPPF